jgi:hypothetical protein
MSLTVSISLLETRRSNWLNDSQWIRRDEEQYTDDPPMNELTVTGAQPGIV